MNKYKTKAEFFCVSRAGVDPSLQIDNRVQSTPAAPAASKQHKTRATNSRDERFRSGKDLTSSF